MSEKKQHRSEQARRNYEAKEKQRQRDIRRKEWKAKIHQTHETAFAWAKQHPKKLLAYALAAIAVLLALNILVYLVMPVKPLLRGLNGKPLGVKDNWVVVDCDEGDGQKYYHLADFDLPEGYELDDFSAYNDENEQDFYCTNTSGEGPVQNFYVSAVKNQESEAYLQRLLSMGMHMDGGDPTKAAIAGKDANYVYLVFDASDETQSGVAYGSLCIYMDTPQGSSVSVMINGRVAPAAEIATEEQLLVEAEKILANLTIVD